MSDLKTILQPVTSRTIPEKIFEQIRDKILSGELQPNDRLPSERELIEIYQRSRPTIREALRMLERAGFVEIIPGSSGARIKEMTPSAVEQPLENFILLKQVSMTDLYEFRTVNELACARWAAQRRTDEDVMKMRKIVEKAKTYKLKWSGFLQCDIDFHRAIVEATHNGMARITHQVISKLISNVMLGGLTALTEEKQIENYEDVLRMHSALTDAIQQRDEKKAESLIIAHLDRFRMFMES